MEHLIRMSSVSPPELESNSISEAGTSSVEDRNSRVSRQQWRAWAPGYFRRGFDTTLSDLPAREHACRLSRLRGPEFERRAGPRRAVARAHARRAPRHLAATPATSGAREMPRLAKQTFSTTRRTDGQNDSDFGGIEVLKANEGEMRTNKTMGAAVAERLARSPPTKVNRAQSPAASQDFRKWESCQKVPWSAGFLGDLPLPPPLHSGAAPYSLQPLSSVLKTALLRDSQISSLAALYYHNIQPISS
ncbi:hypothetical protein PR048_020639 [Dryococelus australis]|uniref:Uncharacterized protein n=1 Tax=Dryococelus australis TaxID=614101 RepID=A0ABQ9H6Y2_9NEOP|nr:hypothetical protein PR048_020639 [Dryococelus australis]